MLLPRDPQMDEKQNIIICVQYTRTSLTDVQYKQIKKGITVNSNWFLLKLWLRCIFSIILM